jgi:hypothetical protein
MCTTMQPCGGNVAGSWTITSSCIDFTLDLGATCPGLTASGTTTNTGSVTFKGDLTYEETFTTSGTVRYQFPSSCLGGRTCPELQDALMQAGSPMASFTSVACRAVAAGCDCEGAVVPASTSESGTYTVAGGILTTAHDGTTDQNAYCVAGDVMYQMPVADPGSPAGTVAGTVTFSRVR